MSTTTPVITDDQTLFALAQVNSGVATPSSEVDISGKLQVLVNIHFGRLATTALTVPCRIRLEVSTQSSGQGHWHPLFEHQTLIATAETESVSGTVNAGQAVITVSSTSNLVAGEPIFIQNPTFGNGEFVRIESVVTNTSVTGEDNLVNAQTGGTIWDQAEILPPVRVGPGWARMRLVVENTGTGQAVAVEAKYSTLDSLSTAA